MELRTRGRAAAAACGILAAACLFVAAPVHAAQPDVAASGFSTPGALAYASADSPTDAWAVGWRNAKNNLTTPIVVHWNGSKWSATPIPKVRYAYLDGVDAVSPSDAWAVGLDDDPITLSNYEEALVLHWNGKAWSRIESPLFAGDIPGAVAATAKSVWIFGSSQIWHLSGGAWHLLPASNPVHGDTARGIGVAWPSTFWWGGGYQPATGPETSYVIRWNGTAWKRVANPMDRPYDTIEAMAGGPHGAVWAVGWTSSAGGTGQFATSMLWNGKTWRRAGLNAESFFNGVAFIPGGGAWAVGAFAQGGRILAARWTGSAWQPVTVPFPVTCDLLGVTATSAHNAWGVGDCRPAGGTESTWIVHWNGKGWS